MAQHTVQVMADGRLETAEPHGKGYRFSVVNKERTVVGVLINGRYVPRTPPAVLGPGDVFDVTAEDVRHAIHHFRPVERHPGLGLQVFRMLVDKVAGTTDPLDPENPVRLQNPGFLVDDRAETVWGWHDRTYTTHMTLKKTYLRDLILRSAGIYILARGCRILSIEGEVISVRAQAFESM